MPELLSEESIRKDNCRSDWLIALVSGGGHGLAYRVATALPRQGKQSLLAHADFSCLTLLVQDQVGGL